jgi:hypothetical protein
LDSWDFSVPAMFICDETSAGTFAHALQGAVAQGSFAGRGKGEERLTGPAVQPRATRAALLWDVQDIAIKEASCYGSTS